MFDPLHGATRNGSPGNGCRHAERRGTEAYLKPYVEATRGEPVRLEAENSLPGSSQPGYLLLLVSNESHGGCRRSHHE